MLSLSFSSSPLSLVSPLVLAPRSEISSSNWGGVVLHHRATIPIASLPPFLSPLFLPSLLSSPPYLDDRIGPRVESSDDEGSWRCLLRPLSFLLSRGHVFQSVSLAARPPFRTKTRLCLRVNRNQTFTLDRLSGEPNR